MNFDLRQGVVCLDLLQDQLMDTSIERWQVTTVSHTTARQLQPKYVYYNFIACVLIIMPRGVA